MITAVAVSAVVAVHTILTAYVVGFTLTLTVTAGLIGWQAVTDRDAHRVLDDDLAALGFTVTGAAVVIAAGWPLIAASAARDLRRWVQ